MKLISAVPEVRRSIRRVCLPVLLVATLTSPARETQASSNATAPGVIVPGDIEATITEWTVPGTNSGPQGIFFSKRDGVVWYSAERSSTLGRFDVKLQKFQEVHLRPDTMPNSLVEHAGSGIQSTLYFTSREGGYIGEFDPNTREVREFRIPGRKVRLQNLSFDRNGVIWFTIAKPDSPDASQKGSIGRLNLFSSEIRMASASDPYDVAVNTKGTIFFTELGSPRIGSVQPDSMKVTEHVLPNAHTGVRNLTITPDDILWYTDSARGYLGRFDPSTQQFQEWPSPSGPESRPGAITNVDGMLWYAETGTEPNILVCFDPATQKFQSWRFKAGGGIGHIYAQSDGTLWLTRPEANGIAELKRIQKRN